MSGQATVAWDEALTQYDFGPGHPLAPVRVALTGAGQRFEVVAERPSGEPVGVVVAITPWNFPIAIPAWKIAPALAYGNTVVWKPAELVPLTSVRLLQALLEAGLPEGVLNLVLGRGSVVGEALVTAPAV